MNWSLFSYFFSYIFKSRTRQKLIFLAIVGLLISSFSLTVLQGIMGGLQNGLINRSKNVLGSGFIDVSKINNDDIGELMSLLDKKQVKYVPELELELMVQNGNFISPIIIHGMDFKKFVPDFLQNKDKTDLVVGSDLGRELRSFYGSRILVTSPAHAELLLQEIPRQGGTSITDFYASELPEIDGVHGWVRVSFLQNMIRKRKLNKLRIYDESLDEVRILIKPTHFDIHLESWEDQNSTLVWALNLETKVMLFLFIGMSFLIGICITSGFLIFYNKVKVDLASFWILGLSKARVMKLVYSFGQVVTVLFSLCGVLLGVAFLYLLETNKFVIMPEHFVERNIPVKLETIHILISFAVPYLVSSVFTHLTFKIFNKENYSFISLIRKVG